MQRMLHAATREKKIWQEACNMLEVHYICNRKNLLPKHSKLIITIRWMISHYTLSGLPQH